MRYQNRRSVFSCLLACLMPIVGCGGFSLESLLPPFLQQAVAESNAYIAQGTFESRSQFLGGTCFVWLEESGVVYHLFQGQSISSADFDRITTPGTVSRLLIVPRNDIPVGCQQGNVVEVQGILE